MVTEEQEKALTVRDWLYKASTVKQLESALPGFMNGDRFLRVFWSAMMVKPQLMDCTEQSILSTMIQCAQLGLEPILGRAALIPFKNKGKLEVQFQPMYRGLTDLARRTGEIKITGHGVYEKDEFDITYGSEEKVYHKPFLKGDRGELMGAYTVWTFQESGIQTEKYMRREDIEYIRDNYSKSWKNSGLDSVWGKHPREMFVKTVLKNHSKLQPCSIEMEHAVNLDDKVEIGSSTTGLFLPGTEGKFIGIPPAPVTVSDMGLGEKTSSRSRTEKSDPLKDAMKKSREKEDEWTVKIVNPSGAFGEEIMQYVESLCKKYDSKVDVITKGALADPQGFIASFNDWRAISQHKTEDPGTKKEVTPDPDYDPELEKEYWNLRNSKEPDKGINHYVFQNRDRIMTFPKDNYLRLKNKFIRLTGKNWPFDEGDSQGEGENGQPGGDPGAGPSEYGSDPGKTDNSMTNTQCLDEFDSRLVDASGSIETDNPRMNNDEFQKYLDTQARKRSASIEDLKIWVIRYDKFNSLWDGFLRSIGIPTNGEGDE